MLHPRPIRRVCATAILFAGCGGDQAADRHEPLVDTIRSGTIVVQNSEQGLWDVDPGARWTIVESVRIGSSDGFGPDVFGSVSTLVVDDLDRIWVADALANELRVFEADGRSQAEAARCVPLTRHYRNIVADWAPGGAPRRGRVRGPSVHRWQHPRTGFTADAAQRAHHQAGGARVAVGHIHFAEPLDVPPSSIQTEHQGAVGVDPRNPMAPA